MTIETNKKQMTGDKYSFNCASLGLETNECCPLVNNATRKHLFVNPRSCQAVSVLCVSSDGQLSIGLSFAVILYHSLRAVKIVRTTPPCSTVQQRSPLIVYGAGGELLTPETPWTLLNLIKSWFPLILLLVYNPYKKKKQNM